MSACKSSNSPSQRDSADRSLPAGVESKPRSLLWPPSELAASRKAMARASVSSASQCVQLIVPRPLSSTPAEAPEALPPTTAATRPAPSAVAAAAPGAAPGGSPLPSSAEAAPAGGCGRGALSRTIALGDGMAAARSQAVRTPSACISNNCFRSKSFGRCWCGTLGTAEGLPADGRRGTGGRSSRMTRLERRQDLVSSIPKPLARERWGPIAIVS
mmetsp:Transcript_49267/g.139731  ORF Transcript_49267/g.139731 Transcript_49267/m.139731 type:complete len:215 (-) Transcript_49267:73-717(-)